MSPLLSNIVLNELDKELDKRGLCFVRYADDFSIFLKTSRAAHRVKRRITRHIEDRLHLKVNTSKSAIRRPLNYEYLGYAFESVYRKGSRGQYRRRVKNLIRLGVEQRMAWQWGHSKMVTLRSDAS